MPFVLTPDMLRCPDCQSGRIVAESNPGTGFRCAECGAFMAQKGALISALPKHLSGDTSANLGHYEEMANSGDSVLDRRAKTRNHRIKFETIAKILGLGDGDPAKSVLEVGVGSGVHGAEFARRGHQYVGLDISIAALCHATRQNAPLTDAPLIAGDATAIPLRDNLFDAVYCVATLHHLPEPLDGLREIIRVLRPGGVFCFMEPRWYYPVHLYGYLRQPDVEVGTFKIRSGRLFKALRGCGLHGAKTTCCVYTPNRPAWLIPAYDLVDRVCTAIPPFHMLSVMRCIHGVK